MDILLDLLKDKKALIGFLLATVEQSDREVQGLQKLCDSLTREDPNLTPANMAKCIAVTMKQTAKHSFTIKRLATIALIQAQSSDFDGDVAQMMNKMGRGQEALQQMLKNKLGI